MSSKTIASGINGGREGTREEGREGGREGGEEQCELLCVLLYAMHSLCMGALNFLCGACHLDVSYSFGQGCFI